jgi:hypothetical protein
MTPITLSRFEKSARCYTMIDGYKACLSSEHDNCASIQGYMDGLIRQLYSQHDEPTGWSFAEWRKGTNLATNLIGANAIMLEYALSKDDSEIVTRLHDKASRLGWTFFLIDTETKQGNTITVVFPLTSLINQAQYARLASILAEQLDEYRMEHGSLAATHIVQVHRSTTPIVFHGTALDPEKEIKRTAKLYQRLNARNYEGTRPVSKPLTQSEDAPQAIEDGLFVFFEKPAEKAQREALEVMARFGFAGE